MRHFSSYGPLDPSEDFHVDRSHLVNRVVEQLVGSPDKGGHYFTIFAPRQAGKTTTLREAVAHIKAQYGDRFNVGMATLHQMNDLRDFSPIIFDLAFQLKIETPPDWRAMHQVFGKDGPLKKPTILILDEFDGLPREAINEAVAFFRQLYLQREGYFLHGLALIGVHAVLGTIEHSNSPFNVQRSIHIPNLTHNEVVELYAQYQQESGQRIEPEVVERIYKLMRGQPGLTCWFGEILTEKTNPAEPSPYNAKEAPEAGFPPITLSVFEKAQQKALYLEWNTNIRNLLHKANQSKDFLVQLFYSHDIPYELHEPQVQWLYLNGLIAAEENPDAESGYACVFASPFVQKCIFSAYSRELVKAVSPLELVLYSERASLQQGLSQLDVPAILSSYCAYLKRQIQKGEAPWEHQPTRGDARAYEAIGHFNLYAWLYTVSRGKLVITPEFRTRNGTADLVLRQINKPHRTVLEIKSFSSKYEHEEALEQVARYAKRLGLSRAYLVVLVDQSGWAWLQSQPVEHSLEGISLCISLIPWGWAEGEPSRRIPEKQSPVEPTAGALQTAVAAPSRTRPRGSTRKRKPTYPRLNLDDRLALEELVLPLLTASQMHVLWGRLGFKGAELSQADTIAAWQDILNHCESEQRLSDLFKLLVYTFPSLKESPLLQRLRAEAL